MADIINLPEKFATSEKKWIVAFDEFQEITKLNGENFEKLMRSQIQHHTNVSYLFLGSKTHLLKDMFNNKNRAFYNAASVMSIDTIEESKSIEYIYSRFWKSSISIEPNIAAYLIQVAGNIPYYIQFIASEIWQDAIISGKNRIQNSDIDKAVNSVIELKADYYWELTNHQTAYRKKILFALSFKTKELFSKQTTSDFQLGAASSTQKALEVLIDEGIVERNQTGYTLADPLFEIFLKHNL